MAYTLIVNFTVVSRLFNTYFKHNNIVPKVHAKDVLTLKIYWLLMLNIYRKKVWEKEMQIIFFLRLKIVIK